MKYIGVIVSESKKKKNWAFIYIWSVKSKIGPLTFLGVSPKSLSQMYTYLYNRFMLIFPLFLESFISSIYLWLCLAETTKRSG